MDVTRKLIMTFKLNIEAFRIKRRSVFYFAFAYLIFGNNILADTLVMSFQRSEESREHKVGVTEILPPCGRLTSC